MGSIPRLALTVLRFLLTCFVFVMGVTALGQANSSRPTGSSTNATQYVPTLRFDVASVRECPPGPKSNGFYNPLHNARLTGTCVWAIQLIGWAYGVDYRVQVLNALDWVQMARSNEVRFDVQAIADSTTDDKLAKLSDAEAKLEKQHMLQELLKDRFGLQAHMETRQEAALALTIAKHGPKLQKGEPMGLKCLRENAFDFLAQGCFGSVSDGGFDQFRSEPPFDCG